MFRKERVISKGSENKIIGKRGRVSALYSMSRESRAKLLNSFGKPNNWKSDYNVTLTKQYI